MNSLSIPPVTMEQVAVERLRIGLDTYVSRNAVVHFEEDVLLNGFKAGLRSEVLAQELDSRQTSRTVAFEMPTSSWQMFKREHEGSWWLGWLVRRRPARTKTHTTTVTLEVDAFAIYPDARIALPECDFGKPFLIHRPRIEENR